MKRPRPAPWDRRKELLVIVPADAEGPQPAKRWSPVIGKLAEEWRVFWVRAPKQGERVPAGRAGFDAVTIDTMPAVRRVLSEHEISGVFLVGGETVESCLEPLHAFAAHVPFVVVLDSPWPAPRAGKPPVHEPLEFTIALADRVLLNDPSLRAPLEPLTRRLSSPVDDIPDPRRKKEFAAFCEEVSRSLKASYVAAQARMKDPTPPALIGLLPDGVARAERKVGEWRRCLPDAGERWLIAPAGLSGAHARRLARAWPRARLLVPRGEEHRVELVNRALRSCSREFALLVTGRARLQPLAVERLVSCARKLPLVGAVGANRPAEDAPSGWREWTGLASAWAMRYNGSYRRAAHVGEDCVLVRRAALDAVGLLDPRVGLRLSMRDFGLRLRQAGFNLFVAEDALVDAPPVSANGHHPPYSDAFVRKWNLDPLALLPPKPR